MLDVSIGDPLSRLSNLVMPDKTFCMADTYTSDVSSAVSSDWKTVAKREYHRIWYHQQCFELGLFQTSSLADYPFSANVPVDFFTSLCQDIYNTWDLSRLQSSIQTNFQNFGGQNYQATRVVFSNGQLDPWSGPGYFRDPPNPQTRIVYIPGASHCADIGGYQDNNPQALNEGVDKIKQYLKEFLSN